MKLPKSSTRLMLTHEIPFSRIYQKEYWPDGSYASPLDKIKSLGLAMTGRNKTGDTRTPEQQLSNSCEGNITEWCMGEAFPHWFNCTVQQIDLTINTQEKLVQKSDIFATCLQDNVVRSFDCKSLCRYGLSYYIPCGDGQDKARFIEKPDDELLALGYVGGWEDLMGSNLPLTGFITVRLNYVVSVGDARGLLNPLMNQKKHGKALYEERYRATYILLRQYYPNYTLEEFFSNVRR